jgi:PAS domain S-box-containing protein
MGGTASRWAPSLEPSAARSALRAHSTIVATDPPTLAVVGRDDDPRADVAARLERAGYEVASAPSASAIDPTASAPSLVVVISSEDVALSTQLATARHCFPNAVMVVMTNAADDVRAALEGGADDAVRLGEREELVARVRRRLDDRRNHLALERRRHGAEMVLELTRALSSTLDLRTLLHTVVRRIAEMVEVDRASIVLGSSEEDIAYVVATSDDESLRDLPIQLGSYPEIAQVLAGGEPLIVEDAASHPLMRMPQVVLPERYRALTLFPISFEGRAIGALFLRFRDRRSLGEEDTFALEAIANAAGIALRNASLLENLREEHRLSRDAHRNEMRTLQRYVDYFESSADGILVIDGRGEVVFENPAACKITGRSADELRKLPLREMLDDDGKLALPSIRESFRRGEIPQSLDMPITRPDGERRILSVTFSRLHHESRGVIISLRDVTAERTLARELTQTKEFLQRVIDSSVDAIVSADMRGNVLLFNPAAERTYGYQADEVVGVMNVRGLYPEGQAQEIMRLIRSHEGGPPGVLQGYEAELLGKSGERIPVVLSAALIDHRGQPIGSVGVFKDLRAKLAIEERLAKAPARAGREGAEGLHRRARRRDRPRAQPAPHHGDGLREPHPEEDRQRRRRRPRRGGHRSRRRAHGGNRSQAGKADQVRVEGYVGETKIIDIEASVDSEPPSREL